MKRLSMTAEIEPELATIKAVRVSKEYLWMITYLLYNGLASLR
jgi:hypothetical protein